VKRAVIRLRAWAPVFFFAMIFAISMDYTVFLLSSAKEHWHRSHEVILGIAVLLDAMLVRLVLIPTLLRVFGRYAWARPQWLQRLLPDVRFGHA
jgi:RND superfamily putative drug exporter